MTRRVRPREGKFPRVAPSATVEAGAEIGRDAVVGSFCLVAKGAKIGDGCRIQSHTSVWAGVTLEQDVFVGPHAVFTNVKHPRSRYPRAPHWDETLVEDEATIGANATIVAPVRIGHHAMVGAGAIVVKDVPPHAVVVGNPARIAGWACACGEFVSRETEPPADLTCAECRGSGRSRDST